MTTWVTGGSGGSKNFALKIQT
ncbi:hypothetical protein AYI70_g891, partial [Smittium culicis]